MVAKVRYTSIFGSKAFICNPCQFIYLYLLLFQLLRAPFSLYCYTKRLMVPIPKNHRNPKVEVIYAHKPTHLYTAYNNR